MNKIVPFKTKTILPSFKIYRAGRMICPFFCKDRAGAIHEEPCEQVIEDIWGCNLNLIIAVSRSIHFTFSRDKVIENTTVVQLKNNVRTEDNELS